MTISCGDDWHLYAECLDGDFVYLDVEGAEWVESFGSQFHREYTKEKTGIEITKKQMVLKMPRKVAEDLFLDGQGFVVDGMPLKEHDL